MKFQHPVLLAASVVAAVAAAPAFAQEHEVGHWLPAVGAWRYQAPPAPAARPSEELPAVETLVDFVVRATDPTNYRGRGTADAAERSGGRYVFDVWFRGQREHSLVLVLPTSPDEVPSAWLLTRNYQHRQPVAIEALMRMVDRALDQSRRDPAQPEVAVTWRPLPAAPPPGAAAQSTGKQSTSSAPASFPSFAGGVRVASGDVNGDGKIADGALAAGAEAEAHPAKQFNGLTSRFPAGGRDHASDAGPGRVDVKFPSLPPQGGGDSSRWVRVSQPHPAGSVMLPRVGWEAQINAVSGMPLGAGPAVQNAREAAGRTSSPPGADQPTTVGGNRSITVGGGQTETAGDMHLKGQKILQNAPRIGR